MGYDDDSKNFKEAEKRKGLRRKKLDQEYIDNYFPKTHPGHQYDSWSEGEIGRCPDDD
jgi:hypothetical protein